MGEAKRVPTWFDIFEVEATLKALGDASSATTRAASVFDENSDLSGTLSDACATNIDTARALRDWLREMRPLREAEDIERKKAGLT